MHIKAFDLEHIALSIYMHDEVMYTMCLCLCKKTFRALKERLKIIIFFLDEESLCC